MILQALANLRDVYSGEKMQYIDSTLTQFKVHFKNHKSSIINKKKTCEIGVHCKSSMNDLKDIKFIAIEKVFCESDKGIYG